MNFRFKQFCITQSDVSMKVNTDGVLLGAWADAPQAGRALDIGTGTGVIALMLAQRYPLATIDAVEKNEATAGQAQANIAASPWNRRITVYPESIQAFAARQSKQYDLIVSNPPFFTNALPSPIETRTLARHAGALPHPDLISCAQQLLAPGGHLCIILPVNEGEAFIDTAREKQLYCNRATTVFSSKAKPPKRLLLSFSARQTPAAANDEIAIHPPGSNEYTAEYKALTADFYLNF